MLTAGACLALNAHASDELKDKYLPNMYAGIWAGSMCLTEPHAGTDLGIIRTRAEPQADGSYKISGTKIFITGGEQDLTENIIHLVPVSYTHLVVGVRLGCINHALLSAEAILGDGLALAGWVANVVDPPTSRLEENLATLAERLPAPCLGRVPRLEEATPAAVAAHLDLRPLGIGL